MLNCINYIWMWSAFSVFRFLTTKEKFHELLDSGGKGPNDDKASDDAAPKETAEDSLEEPQEKKFKVDPDEQERTGKQDSKRMRGQDKSRPHMKPTSNENRLSFHYSGRNATLGDRWKGQLLFMQPGTFHLRNLIKSLNDVFPLPIRSMLNWISCRPNCLSTPILYFSPPGAWGQMCLRRQMQVLP